MTSLRGTGRLAARQSLVAALVALLLGLVFGVLQVTHDYGESADSERRSVEQLLAVMRESAAQASYNLSAPAAAGVVQGVLRFDAVREVELVNDFGETLARDARPSTDAELDVWWSHLVPRERTYSLPLQFGAAGKRVGELRVIVSQAPRIERFLQGVWRAAGLSVVRALAVALTLGLISYATLTRPLTAIAQHMRDVGSGEAARELSEATRPDEIGQIAAAFLRYEDEARQKSASLQASAAELAASEARYRRLVDTAGEGVWQVDLQGRTTFANEAMADMLGTTPARLMGRAMAEFIDPDEPQALARAGVRRSGSDRLVRQQRRFVRNDGRILRAEVAVCPIMDAQGREAGTFAMVADATERLHMDDELRATNERLHTTVEALEGHKRDMAEITELNELLQSARDEREAIDVISASAQRLFGDRAGGLSMVDVKEGDMVRVGAWGANPWVPQRYTREACWAIRRGTSHEQSPRRGLRCAHHPHDMVGSTLCAPLYIEGELLGVLHVADAPDSPDAPFDRAVRQRVQMFGEVVKLGLSNLRLREHLLEQAVRDALTGLPNRRMFDETLPRELARCARAGQSLTLAAIDVDHFKRFNDQYGHKVGDQVLQVVAATLARSVRAGDLCCRYGGDEFLCLLVGMNLVDAKARFERVQAELATGEPALAAHLPERVTFTVGLALAPPGGTEMATLIQAADAALYVAKARGRNRVEVAEALQA